ncbi:MAG: hypothetical protein Kow0037_29260 [Calditrichia bacterium]
MKEPEKLQESFNPYEITLHYLIAHVYFKEFFTFQPENCLAFFKNEDWRELVKKDMAMVYAEGGDEEGDEEIRMFSWNELYAQLIKVGENRAILLEMPRPIRQAEAYFTCMVFKEKHPLNPFDVEFPFYFTLELAADDIPNYFCMWLLDRHINFKFSIEPTKEAFLQAVKECADYHIKGLRKKRLEKIARNTAMIVLGVILGIILF